MNALICFINDLIRASDYAGYSETSSGSDTCCESGVYATESGGNGVEREQMLFDTIQIDRLESIQRGAPYTTEGNTSELLGASSIHAESTKRLSQMNLVQRM